jgi:DNA-binding GntR family transcriptional regulator
LGYVHIEGQFCQKHQNNTRTPWLTQLSNIADYMRKETEVTAVTATAIMANILRCAVGAPLLRVNSVNIPLGVRRLSMVLRIS